MYNLAENTTIGWVSSEETATTELSQAAWKTTKSTLVTADTLVRQAVF